MTGEDFLLVSNQGLKDQARANDPDTVVYLPAEIHYLSGLKSEEVKKLHNARKVFGGELIARNMLEDSIFTRTQKEEAKNIRINNPRLGLKNKIPTERATPAGTGVKEVV